MGDDSYDDSQPADDSVDASGADDGVDASGADDGTMMGAAPDAGTPDAGATDGAVPDDGNYHGTDNGAIFVGQKADGTTMTMPTWGGEQAHIWHEGHNSDPDQHMRSVADQQGNVVGWDPTTGEVVTAMKEKNAPGQTGSVYQISQDIPKFDE
jgi:hypothetical protein